MILAGDKAGNPWHGTWTEDGLALPNETVVALAYPPEGNAAAAGWGLNDSTPRWEPEIWPAHGDCYLVRIPDQPAVTTSEAEAAAGKTWLNYALFCGFNHALYDVRIGRDRFVYIDTDGTPWLVKIRPEYNQGWLDAKFEFLRGFVFDWQGAGGETHSVQAATPWSWWGQSIYNIFVLDASETGNAVSFTAYVSGEAHMPAIIGPVVISMTLSGTPGVDLAVSGVTPFSESEDTRVVVSDPPGELYPDMTAGTYSSRQEEIRVYDGDAAVAIKLGWELDFSAQTWNAALEHYDPVTATGNLLVVTDFGTIEVPATSTITWSSLGDWTCEVDVAGYEFTCSSDDPFTYGQELEFMIPKLVAWRRTNKVIEIALSTITPMPIPESQVHSICLVLPDRFKTTGYLITRNNAGRYFSYHPVTKELLESSEPICFM